MMAADVTDDRPSFTRRLAAEGLGSFFLFAAVIGSGIMAERLAGGNIALALLANSLATGAILFVMIAALASISGAHFNPAVSGAMAGRRALSWGEAAAYATAQLAGGLAGLITVHGMFDLPLLQASAHGRAGAGQWISEFVATFGLILTILGTARHRPDWIAPAVALYIIAAYWFTSSTSFANPAITIVRSLSDSFAGIAPADVPAFVIAQLLGAAAGTIAGTALFPENPSSEQKCQ